MKFSRSLIYSFMALASISFAEEQGVDCQTITEYATQTTWVKQTEAVTATVQPEDRDFAAVSTRTNIVTVTHRPTVTVSADCKEVCEAQSPAAAKTITVSECPARPPKSDLPVQLQQLSTTIASAAGATTEEATTTQYVSIDHTVTMKHSSSTPAAEEPKVSVKTKSVSRSKSAPAPTTTDAEVDAEDKDETEEQCHSDCETVVVTVTKTHPPTQPAGTPLVKAITKAVTRSKSAPAPTTTAHGCQKDGQCHTTVVVVTKTHSSTPGGPCSTDYVTQTITQGQ